MAMITKNSAGAWAVVMLGFTVSGCWSTADFGHVSTPLAAEADDSYWDVIEQWHRKAEWYGDLEEHSSVRAVFLNEEVRSAYLKRFEEVRGERLEVFSQDESSHMAILVSLYSAQSAFTNLADARQWSLFVSLGGGAVRPFQVREVYEKALLQAFFPFINSWSREFLVVFDPAGGSASETAEPLPNTLVLDAKSTQVSFSLEWSAPSAQ